MPKEFVSIKLNWHTNQVSLLPDCLLAKVLLQMLYLPCHRNRFIFFSNSKFPEITEMDDLEK